MEAVTPKQYALGTRRENNLIAQTASLISHLLLINCRDRTREDFAKDLEKDNSLCAHRNLKGKPMGGNKGILWVVFLQTELENGL